ncbi:hypothetical protein D3C72_949510 [compost metagenome]
MAQPVHAETGFHGDGLAKHHVLPVQRFHPHARFVVQADRGREALGRRFDHAHLHRQGHFAVGIKGGRRRRDGAGYGRIARRRGRGQVSGARCASAIDIHVGRLWLRAAGCLQRHERAAKEGGGLQVLLPGVQPILVVGRAHGIAHVTLDELVGHALQAFGIQLAHANLGPTVDRDVQGGRGRVGGDVGLRGRHARQHEIARGNVVQQGRLGAVPIAVDERLPGLELPVVAQSLHALGIFRPRDAAREFQVHGRNGGALAGHNADIPGFPADVGAGFQRHLG